MKARKSVKLKLKTFHGFKLDRRGNFNGKPIDYWQTEADKLVMYGLVTLYKRFDGGPLSSLPGKLAFERLQKLATDVDPVLFARTCMEFDRMRENAMKMLGGVLAGPAKKKKR